MQEQQCGPNEGALVAVINGYNAHQNPNIKSGNHHINQLKAHIICFGKR